MPRALKRNTIIVIGIALLFYWVFMFLKHDPALQPVIPFGEDPYDAVGSFGVVVALLIAVLSLVRAFRPYGSMTPSPTRQAYLVRTQTAVVLCALITLSADVVAMARHPSPWIGTSARFELVAVLVGMAVAAVTALLIIRASASQRPPAEPRERKHATAAACVTLLILAAYPEQLIQGTLTHLLTVIAGALLLFAPMRYLLRALMPIAATAHQDHKPGTRSWLVAGLVGIAVGVFAFIGEMSEGGSSPQPLRLAVVALVFVGLATIGLLVAYAFLGGPLGLGKRG